MKTWLKAGTALATFLAPMAATVSVVAQDKKSDDLQLEEITVTGSYLKRKSAADTTTPISVMGKGELDQLGGNTIADITRTLTANAGAENNPDSFTQNTTAGTENINLRGLGVASTLVLLNGKRTVASSAHTDSGVAFIDTASLLPSIAIDQLELLKNGGASLYGSDAVGGVANFKTRLGFSGLEMSMEYQSAEGDQRDLVGQLLFGHKGDNFQFIAAGSIIDRTALDTRERDLRPAFAEADGLTVSGTTGLPGNWLINLSPTAAGIAPVDDITGDGIPDYNFYGGVFPDAYCGDAIGTIPDIQLGTTDLAGVDQVSCAYDYQNVFDLIPQHSRKQAYAEFNFDFADNHSFYGSFSYSDNQTKRHDSNFPIPFPILIPNAPALIDPSLAAYPWLYPFYYPGLTPTQSPYSLWLGRSPGLGQITDYATTEPNISTTNSETMRYMAGFKGEIGSWTYDVNYIRAKNKYDFNSRDGVTSRLQAAIFGFGGPDCGGPSDPTAIPGFGGCLFYNVRGDGMTADPSDTVDLIGIARDPSTGAPIFLPDGSLATGPSGLTVPVRNSPELLNWITQPLRVEGESTIDVFDAVFAGDVMEMPAGTMQMAIGYQYRKETEKYDYDAVMNAFDFAFAGGANDFDDTRDVHAIFMEAGVPLTENLDLQAALRYEKYSGNIGDTLDPQIALLYRPTTGLSVRASYATSFRAPSVFQLAGNQTNVQNVVEAGYVPVQVSGNPDLNPERSTNMNIGFTWQPDDHWTVNMDVWNIKFKDVIVKETPDNLVLPVLLALQGLPGGDLSLAQLTTGPANPDAKVFVDNSVPGLERVTRIISNYFNSDFIETNGVDLQVSYKWDTADWGAFNVGVDMVYVNKYDVSTDRGVIDGAGSRNQTNFAAPVPQMRANLFATWAKGSSSLSAFVRYKGSFDDDENCLNPDMRTFEVWAAGGTCSEFAKVESFTTVDLQYSLDTSNLLGLENSNLTLGAVNLFNAQPPFVRTDGSYETRTHDPRGRMLYARMKFGF